MAADDLEGDLLEDLIAAQVNFAEEKIVVEIEVNLDAVDEALKVVVELRKDARVVVVPTNRVRTEDLEEDEDLAQANLDAAVGRAKTSDEVSLDLVCQERWEETFVLAVEGGLVDQEEESLVEVGEVKDFLVGQEKESPDEAGEVKEGLVGPEKESLVEEPEEEALDRTEKDVGEVVVANRAVVAQGKPASATAASQGVDLVVDDAIANRQDLVATDRESAAINRRIVASKVDVRRISRRNSRLHWPKSRKANVSSLPDRRSAATSSSAKAVRSCATSSWQW